MVIMLKEICIADFISKKQELPIIDVRSPIEFNKGHILGAINIALFSDEERDAIGKKYKHESPTKAINLGLEFAVPKIEDFINSATKVAPNKKVLLYCARGGMRSHSFAKMLIEAGFEEVFVLETGYKAFRKHVLDSFVCKAKMIVLGGMTGSGKTDILKALEQRGEQILDLEKIGCHKGSSFGGIGQEAQPTSQQFENNIFDRWHRFDFSKRIWVENESIRIGRVNIPEALFEQMQKAKLIELVVEKEIRAKRLVKEYAHFDKGLLKDAVLRIQKRLGDESTKQALLALEKEDYFSLVLLVLVYYDKSYQYGVLKRISNDVLYLPFDHTSGIEEIINNAFME
jgi:tRNA 2-selenouridine synthase